MCFGVLISLSSSSMVPESSALKQARDQHVVVSFIVFNIYRIKTKWNLGLGFGVFRVLQLSSWKWLECGFFCEYAAC